MKENTIKLFIFLTVISLFCGCFIHKHEFNEEWKYDAEYHWHESVCGHKVVSKKERHEWDDGLITKQATFENGEKKITCKFCQATKIEVVPGLELTGEYSVIRKEKEGTFEEKEYITFGTWPQSKKLSSVSVDETDFFEQGAFIYYRGSDGELYAKENNEYFKVEPIIWVVHTHYLTDKKLFLSEKILTKSMPIVEDAETIETRVYVGNGTRLKRRTYYDISKLRDFLNGYGEYEGKGFLQTAFTPEQQKKIAITNVDNTFGGLYPKGYLYSYGYYSYDNYTDYNKHINDINTNTNDKMFILSYVEQIDYDCRPQSHELYHAAEVYHKYFTDYVKSFYVDSWVDGKSKFKVWLRSDTLGNDLTYDIMRAWYYQNSSPGGSANSFSWGNIKTSDFDAFAFFFPAMHLVENLP